MIILDTNVVSELMRPVPHPAVATWAKNQRWTTVLTTSITAYEITFGIERLATGLKQEKLRQIWHDVRTEFMIGRFLTLDAIAAVHSARLRAKANAQGDNTKDICDLLIAGIAIREQACIATRNTKDFAETGVQLINPWEAGN